MRRGRGERYERGVEEASIFHHYISVSRRLEIARSDRYRGPAISPPLCRANYGIIWWRGLFRNTRAPVKSKNSRDSLFVYPGLMRNFPNSDTAFLITVPRLRAYAANNRALAHFVNFPNVALISPRDYRAVNP